MNGSLSFVAAFRAAEANLRPGPVGQLVLGQLSGPMTSDLSQSAFALWLVVPKRRRAVYWMGAIQRDLNCDP